MKRTMISLAAAGAAAVLALGACSSDDDDAAEEEMTDDMTEEMTDDMESEDMTAATDDDMMVPEILEFSATTLDGETIEGSEFAGDPTVLWFWYEDCPICISQGPDVVDLHSEFGDSVDIVGISGPGKSGSSTVEQMQEFVEATDTGALTHIQGGDGELWTHFGITSQSIYVLLDSHGEVADTGSFSGTDLNEKVGELM